MKITKLIILFFILSFHAFANSFTEIKSAIKASDFTTAENKTIDYINASASTSNIDPEIYILKVIIEIGKAIEQDLPSFFSNNFNADESKAIEAFDISGNGPEYNEDSLFLNNQVVGYWYTSTSGKYPFYDEYDDEIKAENRANSMFNWALEPESTSSFEAQGLYFYGNNMGESISYTYNPQSSSEESHQKTFTFDLSQAGGLNLEISFNGQDIGYIGRYHAFLNDVAYFQDDYSQYNYETEQYEYNTSPQIPFILSPGDTLTFTQASWYDTHSGYRIGVTAGLDAGDFITENGVKYKDKPDVGSDITIGDLLSILFSKDAPTRSLINSIVTELDNFINTVGIDTVSLGHEFTGLNTDILIQKADAIAVKSFLEVIDVILGIINQYDLEIGIDDQVIDDGEEIFDTLADFFASYSEILTHKNDAENLIDQSEALVRLNNAFSSLDTAIQTLWYRGSPNDPTDIYLIETSDPGDSSEYEEAKSQLASLKNSLNGYETSASIGGDSDGGISVSLKPLLDSSSPLNLKEMLLDLEGKSDNQILETLNVYGFIKDYLPENFDGKILVFYNSNNTPNSTIVLNKNDNYDVDPIDGELRIFNFSEYGDSSINFSDLEISYLSPSSGTWSSNGYYNHNTDTYVSPISGSFYFYDSLLDLNQNGQPDIGDLHSSASSSDNSQNRFIFDNLNYSSNLDNTYIQGLQLTRYPTPQSLRGYIALEEDDNNSYMYEGGTSNEIVAGYYISNDDWFEIAEEYFMARWIDIEQYEINGDIITFTESLSNMDYYEEESAQLFFNDQFSYIMMEIPGSDEHGDMHQELDIKSGVIYPAYLDLDNDGLADGEGMKAHITPKFNRLPTSAEIQAAIDAYDQANATDNAQPSEGTSENLNALTDSDGDNMPDALELQYGGNPSDPNDATITLNQILSVDRYTLNEITDLRLGSTLYEVSQGVASFNIILEESPDMVNWVQHEPMQINLGEQPDDSSKFYRFKMSD